MLLVLFLVRTCTGYQAEQQISKEKNKIRQSIKAKKQAENKKANKPKKQKRKKNEKQTSKKEKQKSREAKRQKKKNEEAKKRKKRRSRDAKKTEKQRSRKAVQHGGGRNQNKLNSKKMTQIKDSLLFNSNRHSYRMVVNAHFWGGTDSAKIQPGHQQGHTVQRKKSLQN